MFPAFFLSQELLFEENFNHMSFGDSFNENWIVKNIEGKNTWRVSSHKGSKTKLYAKVSGYKGSDIEEDWLILKQDLTSCYNASLTFETAIGYYQHEGLTVWIHDTKDIQKGKKLDSVNLASKKDIKKATFSPFISSGSIDISSFCGGMLYVGFRYLGNHNNESTVFELDNLRITINK